MAKDKFQKKHDSDTQQVPSAGDAEERALTSEEIDRQLAAIGLSSPETVSDDEPLASPIGYVRKHGGLPATKKSLGQNWLMDGNAAHEMVYRFGAKKGDLVVEVGPGAGALTEHLLRTGAEVIAVEIDRRMVDVLEERWGYEPRLRVVHANIMETDLADITQGRKFRLIGNLPYNITSSLLFALMDHAREHPGTMERLMVMLQLEVARRAAAEPGDSVYGQLAVFLRLWGIPEIVMTVPRELFTPAPKVDAGVIQMDVAELPLAPVPHYPTFRRLVKGAFAKRRKMLRNSVPSIPHLAFDETIEFDWTRRPQTLTTAEYAELSTLLIPKRERDGHDEG